ARGGKTSMKIAWVTRSFLDYRIPVFRELDRQCEGNLHLVFSGDYVPERVTNKAVSILGDRAIPLSGEWKIGSEDRNHLANRNFSLRLQPGLIRRIRSIQPDVLVCDGFFKWTFPSLFYRVFTGTPLVILYERTAHVERNAQKVRLWYRKGVLRFTDAMGCNGFAANTPYPWAWLPEGLPKGTWSPMWKGLRQRRKTCRRNRFSA
ncbi:MAG: hypothetical protein ACOC54_05120, partial [Candidatus Sumerlaeota bacterium]